MRWLLTLGLLAIVAQPLLGQVPPQPTEQNWFASALDLVRPQPQRPHPAVVRIIAPERDGMALGSGTLVDTNERYGLVVTNWHVVQSATGEITVVFPDGFRSGARVLKTDRDWDLAALMVWKPNVPAVPLATAAPRPGELLTIAGYGSGAYRAATGRCTQYVSPGSNLPYEMVELSAAARQGDSGGPIFNSQGQLAGVLFGEGQGLTSGSYAGRVRSFLATVVAPAQSASDSRLALAPVPPVVPQPAAPSATERFVNRPPLENQAPPPALEPPAPDTPWRSARPLEPTEESTRPATRPSSGEFRWQDLAGETRSEQVKSSLALVGALVLLLNGVRWLKT